MTDQIEIANDNPNEPAQVLAVQKAVSNLIIKLGFDSAVVFEGALKGGAAALLAKGAKPSDIAEMLEDFAAAFRDLPNEEPRAH